jgi:hypothetical protein
MTTEANVESQSSIDGDLPCLRCEYNLRGLPAEGNCPECGEQIGASLAYHARMRAEGYAPLSLAPRRRLRRLILACALLLSGPLAHLLISAFTLTIPPDAPASTWPMWQRILNQGMWFYGEVAVCAAIWLLTARESELPRSHRARGAAVVLRTAAILYIANPVLLQLYLLMVGEYWQAYFTATEYVQSALSATISAVGWWMISHLAIRGGRGQLCKTARAFAIVQPFAFMAQVAFLREIQIRPRHYWVIVPQAIVGHDLPILLLPFRWRELVPQMSDFIWGALALLSLCACATLIQVWRMCRAHATGASRSRIIPPLQADAGGRIESSSPR